MSDLSIDMHHGDGIASLGLRGELDISTAPRLQRALEGLESAEAVRLDLSGLRFLDSTGLRAVVSAGALARDRGWSLSLVPGPERVQRVFRLARLEERLPFEVP